MQHTPDIAFIYIVLSYFCTKHPGSNEPGYGYDEEKSTLPENNGQVHGHTDHGVFTGTERTEPSPFVS